MSDIKIGLIGGTGLGQVLAGHSNGDGVRRHQIDTPFGPTSDVILETDWSGVPVFLLSRHGLGHLLNPSQVPFRANIFALKQLGVTHIIASGAVGSLREELRPRDLVIPDQIIDRTFRRIGTFYEKAAVHVEFAEPFCPVLRQILLEAGQSLTGDDAPKVHDRACYVCMEGPAFSTKAESLMHRLWGGDLIGMTAMPEAKLAREAEISYALIALVTDYDCWRPVPNQVVGANVAPEPPRDLSTLLDEILANLRSATDNGMRLMRAAVELIATRKNDLPPSPAHQALKLGIWSEKSKIDPQEVQRLAPLWMKYFTQPPVESPQPAPEPPASEPTGDVERIPDAVE